MARQLPDDDEEPIPRNRSTSSGRQSRAVPDEDVAKPERGRSAPKAKADEKETKSSKSSKSSKGSKSKKKRMSADAVAGMVDAAMEFVTEQVAEATGCEDIVDADELMKYVMGIPMPSLALCYLFGTNLWIVGRVIELFGTEGSCKSSFLFEMGRWHAADSGHGVICENENKDAPILMRSILLREAFIKRIKCHPTDTLQDWMRAVTHWTRFLDEKFAEIGYVTPIIMGIDSLMATGDEGDMEKIDTSGVADRAHPVAALKISGYAKTLPKRLRRKPWTLVATNHLKPGTDDKGRPKDNVAGGRSMKFMASLRLKMSKIKDIETTKYGGVRLIIKTEKNSLASGKRSIEVELKWRMVPVGDPGDNRSQQETFWDWGAATIDMLLAACSDPTTKKQIEEILDLKPVSGRRLWSKTLGIPKEKPVKYSDAGIMIEERPDILDALCPVLMISQYPKFEVGENFEDQIERLRKKKKLEGTSFADMDRSVLLNQDIGAPDLSEVDAALDAKKAEPQEDEG